MNEWIGVDGREMVRANFTRAEFQCRCGESGCKSFMATTFLDRLQALRNLHGEPIIVRSGYRCPWHNATMGGAPLSYHVLGMAADVFAGFPIEVGSEQLAAFLANAWGCGFRGFGFYPGWIHLDTREASAPAVWAQPSHLVGWYRDELERAREALPEA